MAVRSRSAFSVGSTTEERWVKEMEMAQQYCDANGIELIVQSADDDANKQITQCQSMISQGVDVLIVATKRIPNRRAWYAIWRTNQGLK